jgi:hypothetical protein
MLLQCVLGYVLAGQGAITTIVDICRQVGFRIGSFASRLRAARILLRIPMRHLEDPKWVNEAFSTVDAR